MKRHMIGVAAAFAALSALATSAEELRDGWRFRREGGEWKCVEVPHDDAIEHDFDPSKYDTGMGALPCFG